MSRFIDVSSITALQEACILRWKAEGVVLSEEDFLSLVEQNHAFNYQLWHAEDRARRDDLGYEFVYLAKREIDAFNQQRNDRMEAMDAWIVRHLNVLSPGACPVHSETPGMMIDRLSILALKSYHMHEQTLRTEVDEQHREACRGKLLTIHAQQQQLKNCLLTFIEEIMAGTRTFCVYHQFKMYNDSSLNPQLYHPPLLSA